MKSYTATPAFCCGCFKLLMCDGQKVMQLVQVLMMETSCRPVHKMLLLLQMLMTSLPLVNVSSFFLFMLKLTFCVAHNFSYHRQDFSQDRVLCFTGQGIVFTVYCLVGCMVQR